MTILTLLLMACITFGSRYLFLMRRLPFELGPRGQRLLSFSAPAVLTAIWAPMVFVRDGELALQLENAYLWGALVAMGVAWRTRSVYWTIGVSMPLFFVLLQWWR